MTTILVIDNYDSFVYNLVSYLGQLGAQCIVHRNDAVTLDEVGTLGVDGVVLSPGPGIPERAGICVDLVRSYAGQLPILGVCLGHQAIAVAFGGSVVRAPELLHGKTSEVHHDGAGVLAGLPDPFTATRYHSLTVDAASVPDLLDVTARTDSGVVMGLRHRTHDIEGVQFHPESVLTEGGHLMLATWLARCGDTGAAARAPALAAAVDERRLAAMLPH
ncbi:MAG: para-aminobenzoate synthetase component [Frankiales bacterium]|jgi:para-aminobenzoate synthetase component 2|nr:para-aminobenzoate synthetase component [Frankiales bacterium]